MTSTHPEPGRITSGVLAVAVHILFITLLVFGIRWQQRVPEPVVVDLWQDIPPPKPEQIVRPPPEPPPPPPAPKPEVQPPEPPKPVPIAKPLPPEQPSRADIELKEKQRKLREQKLAEQERRQEELRKKEEARKEKEEARKEKEEARKQQEAQRREEQARQQELKRQEAAQRKEEEQRQEEVRREDERRMEREAETRRVAILEDQQKLAQAAKVRAEEEARRRAAAEALAARQRQLNEFIGGIRKKIRSRVAVPPGMSSSAEAVYSVTLLPGGEVLEVRLVKSSGVPAYDAAVERAIHAAEPLPVPGDPDMFQQLRQANYRFRPFE